MVPEDAPKTQPEQSSGPPQRARRGGRSGRGRRGRGGRGRRPPPRSDVEKPPPQAEQESDEQVSSYTEAPIAEAAQESEGAPEPEVAPEVEQAPPPHSPPPKHPAAPASVQNAIEDVNRIIETLRESLDDMEEVLETLELAERQKTADEQEIEQLRRSLRHLQHPRDRDRGHSRENR